MKQNKIYLFVCVMLCLSGLMACTPKKPPLEPTQVVNGRSIIVPPEFFVLPKERIDATAEQGDKEQEDNQINQDESVDATEDENKPEVISE